MDRQKERVESVCLCPGVSRRLARGASTCASILSQTRMQTGRRKSTLPLSDFRPLFGHAKVLASLFY